MKYLYILFVWAYALSVYGQVQEHKDEKIYFKKYNGEDFNISVNDIVIDENNRKVVASDKLLFVISGKEKNHQTLWDNANFSSVCVSPDSKIYAGGGNYLYIVEGKEKVTLPVPCIINDMIYHNRRIWLSTDIGILQYHLSSKKWNHFTRSNSKLPSDKINFLSVDKNDIIWIGTEKGYVRIKGKKWEVEDKKENVLSSRSNKEGQWMVSDGNMWLIDPYNRKYEVGLEDNMYNGRVNDFVIDTKDRIYMASNTLVRYDPYTEKIEQFGEGAGILSQKCLSLAADKNDKIWLGTENDGLYYISFDMDEVVELTASLLVKNEVSCHGSSDGSIYLSVAGGTAPYTVTWSDNSSPDFERNNLAAGAYTVQISDADNNTVEQTITLAAPDKIEIEVLELKGISEVGKKDGAVQILASGGHGVLSYKWKHGATGSSLKRLNKGTYTLIVTDEKNCSEETFVHISDSKNIPELASGEMEVGKILTINNLNFDADSTDVSPSNYPILDEVVEFLTKNSSVTIEIGGHTNTIPPHEYCDRLSEQRAKSVAQYITTEGIKANRVSYKGYGKRQPLINSKSLKARKKNQRVEIKILSI